ncbi:MAG: hypothetical protein HWE14_06670 [Flavobacteriia bacterium]|nr:hypothetical protein [Flavobacteriia bacterium]
MKKLNLLLIGLLCFSAPSWAVPYAVFVQTIGSSECPMYHVIVLDDNETPNDQTDDKVLTEGLISDCDFTNLRENSEMDNIPVDVDSEGFSVIVVDTKPITISSDSEDSITECRQFTIQLSDGNEILATGILFEKKCGIPGYGPTR